MLNVEVAPVATPVAVAVAVSVPIAVVVEVSRVSMRLTS